MNYPPQQWRLLITSASPGAWNMALDEAVLEAVDQNLVPPTLRLYAWEPPCLSIGYAQPSSDIDFQCLNALGWDWVRRLTGGRAILHTDELTYSIIAPQSNPRVSGGVLESYRRLSVALITGLGNLDILATVQTDGNTPISHENNAVCFEVPSNYEIVVKGKKLIGSAQARRKNSVLQHGTLPLSGDLTRITRVLNFSDEDDRNSAAVRLLSHATTVELISGVQLDWEAAAEAFISGFQSELNIEFNSSELSDREINRTRQLVEEKYAHPAWLERI